VGSQQGYHPDSPTHPGSVKHYSRHGITNSPQQIRLDALPSSFLSHHGSIRTTGGESFCVQIDPSDTPLLQLETRPPDVSSECIPIGLGPTERLCQPTVVFNWQSYEPSILPASPIGTGSTSVEGSNLVSSTTRNVVGLPQTDSSRSNSENNGCPNGDGPSTSRVACLQERFFSSSLIKEATKFLLQFSGSKSAQSYNSQFRKWAVWCAEMSCNPIDVTNFLVWRDTRQAL